MKQIVIVLLFVMAFSINVSAQRKSDNIDTKEMQEQMGDAMSEFQNMLDTLDFEKFFSQDFSNLFGGSMEGMNFDNLDSLGSISLDELFGEDLFQQFGESMPNDLDMENFGQLMEESMKMFEQIDMSELEKMFEGLDFDFEGFEEMMPSDEMDDKNNNSKIKKKSKLKKI